MSSKDDIIHKIRAGNFRENNGLVMRTINILSTKYVKLKDLKYALPRVPETDIIDCVDFLQEEAYIRLRDIETKEETQLADATDHDSLEAKVTGKGTRLLRGIIPDKLVDV